MLSDKKIKLLLHTLIVNNFNQMDSSFMRLRNNFHHFQQSKNNGRTCLLRTKQKLNPSGLFIPFRKAKSLFNVLEVVRRVTHVIDATLRVKRVKCRWLSWRRSRFNQPHKQVSRVKMCKLHGITSISSLGCGRISKIRIKRLALGLEFA